MPITGAQLKQGTAAIPGGASGRQVAPWDELAAGANRAMSEIGLKTRLACATFLATCTLESAYWRTTEEYGGSKTRYAPYFGRGFIQTTWEEGYRNAGKYAVEYGLYGVTDPEFFVKNPQRLGEEKYAWLGAVEYYTRRRSGSAWMGFESLAELANSSTGSISRISRAVNRGNPATEKAAYHEEQRAALSDAFYALGDAIIPPGAPAPTPKVKASQIAVDGVVGLGTTRALQKLAGTAQDGEISDQPKSIRDTRIVGETLDTHWPTIDYGSGGSQVIAWLQRQVGARQVDGYFGPATRRALQKKVGVRQDGTPGPATVRGLQKWINKELEERAS